MEGCIWLVFRQLVRNCLVLVLALEQDTIGIGIGEQSMGCCIWLVFVQTIGEKLPALVPILRPVPDLVICKKHPADLLLFPQKCNSNSK